MLATAGPLGHFTGEITKGDSQWSFGKGPRTVQEKRVAAVEVPSSRHQKHFLGTASGATSDLNWWMGTKQGAGLQEPGLCCYIWWSSKGLYLR